MQPQLWLYELYYELAISETGQQFITHVSDVLSHSLALHKGGDTEAVVPVATAEEQLPIM